jgi:hypothetical protein
LWILFLAADGTVNAEQKLASATGGFTGALDDNDDFGFSVPRSATSTTTASGTWLRARASTTMAGRSRRRVDLLLSGRRHASTTAARSAARQEDSPDARQRRPARILRRAAW